MLAFHKIYLEMILQKFISDAGVSGRFKRADINGFVQLTSSGTTDFSSVGGPASV